MRRMVLVCATYEAGAHDASTGELDPLQLRSLLLNAANIVSLIIIVVLSGSPRSFAAEQPSDVPAWLQAHVGEGEDQIAPVVLERARALYLRKAREGAVKNPCYFAMDATRPHVLGNVGRRFYVICEADRSFARFRPVTAAVAICAATQISQTANGARRTSAMRCIPS